MLRRKFLKEGSAALLILSNGKIVRLSDSYEEWLKKPVLRFVVASDGHYGQKNTEYEKYYAILVNRINELHQENPFAFCVFNGDIIHDDKKTLSAEQLNKMAANYLSNRFYLW